MFRIVTNRSQLPALDLRAARAQTRSNKHNKHGAFHHALLSGMSFGMIDPKTWVNLSSDEAAAAL